MNIFSGEKGLGAALTNPTELGRRKGMISEKYRIVFEGKTYPDVEAAYHSLKSEHAGQNDSMMIELIACKFRQHPRLLQEVREKGGAAWLETCSHITGFQTPSAARWEGTGLESRFIRNLVAGFKWALSEAPVGQAPQFDLF